jgi:hypothetical protein
VNAGVSKPDTSLYKGALHAERLQPRIEKKVVVIAECLLPNTEPP